MTDLKGNDCVIINLGPLTLTFYSFQQQKKILIAKILYFSLWNVYKCQKRFPGLTFSQCLSDIIPLIVLVASTLSILISSQSIILTNHLFFFLTVIGILFARIAVST